MCIRDSAYDETGKGLVDYYYAVENESSADNMFLAFNYILVAQGLALFKSLSYDSTPDNPCPVSYTHLDVYKRQPVDSAPMDSSNKIEIMLIEKKLLLMLAFNCRRTNIFSLR